MHSLINIIGIVLTGKENYREWYIKIKSNLIFNDLSNGICEVVNEEEVELATIEIWVPWKMVPLCL
jgi:hypothetical protein